MDQEVVESDRGEVVGERLLRHPGVARGQLGLQHRDVARRPLHRGHDAASTSGASSGRPRLRRARLSQETPHAPTTYDGDLVSQDELETAHCWEPEDRVPGRPEMTDF